MGLRLDRWLRRRGRIGGNTGRLPLGCRHLRCADRRHTLALALGGRTYKLKFGHRGGNQPVKDLRTGRVTITSQNHGFAVDPDSLPPEIEVTHINLNDGTVEGMRHRTKPIFCVQYHPEASPGPHDSTGLFARFRSMIEKK